MSRVLVVVAASLTLLAAAPEDVASRVAHDIMSPFCPGVTLHDCPSGEADDLRREIATMASAGMSHDEIVAELESEYGPGIRATPEGPVARVLPWAAALAGLVAAWLLTSRFAARRDGAPNPAAVSDADRARLDAELDAFKRNNLGTEA